MQLPAPDQELTTSEASVHDRSAQQARDRGIVVTLVVLVSLGLFVVASEIVPSVLFYSVTESIALAVAFATLLYISWQSLLGRARRARRRADGYRETSTGRPLTPGHAVLHGRVAYAPGASEAMRVEPVAETSQLFDTLEAHPVRLPLEETPRRARVAQLDRDEAIWASGELVAGEDPETTDEGVSYRKDAHARGLVLRAAPTLLVSSFSLVDHFTKRAWMHRVQGWAALALLVLPTLIAARLVDRAQGHAVQGVVERTVIVRSIGKWTKGDTALHAVVLANGVEYDTESLPTLPAEGSPFVLRVGRYTSNDGPDVAGTGGEAIASVFLLVVIALVAWRFERHAVRSLPWFRSTASLVERGAGRLQG